MSQRPIELFLSLSLLMEVSVYQPEYRLPGIPGLEKLKTV